MLTVGLVYLDGRAYAPGLAVAWCILAWTQVLVSREERIQVRARARYRSDCGKAASERFRPEYYQPYSFEWRGTKTGPSASEE